MNYDIKAFPQWVNWSNRSGKKFFATASGDAAKSNDPQTWTDYESACNAGKPCFVLSESDPFFGIDLDDCIEDGRLTDVASQIISPFMNRALIEISQSGTGIHITAVGKKPIERSNWTIDGQRVEVYDRARFWIVTFRPLFPGDSQDMLDCQGQLDSVVAWMEGQQARKKTPKPTIEQYPTHYSTSDLEDRARSTLPRFSAKAGAAGTQRFFAQRAIYLGFDQLTVKGYRANRSRR
jgi:putative DNA primase/helicase